MERREPTLEAFLESIPTIELYHACAVRAAQLIQYRDETFKKLLSDYQDASDGEKESLIKNYNKATILLDQYEKLLGDQDRWIRRVWNYIYSEDDAMQIGPHDYINTDKAPALTDPRFASAERMKEWVTPAEAPKAEA